MAITTSVAIAVTSNVQRSWRINIEAPFGGDEIITAFRQTLGLDATGKVQQTGAAPSVIRSASALIAANEPAYACADGTQITIAHLAEAIAGLCDRWAVADAAAPPEV